MLALVGGGHTLRRRGSLISTYTKYILYEYRGTWRHSYLISAPLSLRTVSTYETPVLPCMGRWALSSFFIHANKAPQRTWSWSGGQHSISMTRTVFGCFFHLRGMRCNVRKWERSRVWCKNRNLESMFAPLGSDGSQASSLQNSSFNESSCKSVLVNQLLSLSGYIG